MFACNLFGIDRFIIEIKKKNQQKEAKAIEVNVINQVRKTMPGLVVEIISHING
jgi:hypothetical protein